MKDVDWISLMNDLKTTSGWSTDVQIADYCKVSRSMISIIRSGTQEMPSAMKIRVMIGLGKMNTCCEAFSALELCLPPKIAAAVREINCECRKESLD